MQIWYIFLCPLWVRYSSKRWFCNLAFSLFYCVLSNGMPWPRFKNIGSQHGSIKYQPLILLTQMRFNNITQYLVSAIIEKYSCTFWCWKGIPNFSVLTILMVFNKFTTTKNGQCWWKIWDAFSAPKSAQIFFYDSIDFALLILYF